MTPPFGVQGVSIRRWPTRLSECLAADDARPGGGWIDGRRARSGASFPRATVENGSTVESSKQRFRPLSSRRLLGLGVLVVLVLAVLLGSFLYDRSRSDLIAPGLTVAGIEVG